MNITVNVTKAWSSGEQAPVSTVYGTSVAAVCASLGAPSGCIYTVNGVKVPAEHGVGEGDMIIASRGKIDAG